MRKKLWRTFTYAYTKKDLAILFGLFAVYFVAGKVGLSFASVNPSASAIWPPTGIAVAALILLGYRFWPAIFIGALFLHAGVQGTFSTSLGIALGNTLEPIIGTYLTNRFANGRKAFEEMQSIFKFAFFAGVLGAGVSATIGVTSLALAGFVPLNTYASVWFTWLLGDTGGALIVAPFLILWAEKSSFTLSRNRVPEFSLLILASLVAGWMVFEASFPFISLAIPLFVWSALRFGRRITVTLIVFLSVIAIISIFNGNYMLVGKTPNDSLIIAQMCISVTALTFIGMAAIIRKNKIMLKNLRQEEAKIIEAKAKEDAILMSIGDALVVTDKEGAIILMNPQAERMFEWKLEKAFGWPVANVVMIEDENGVPIEKEKRPITLALTSQKKITTTDQDNLYYVKRNGTRIPVGLTATPVILDNAVVGAIALVRDITFEKEIDRSKNEFISIASHQLRTPLSSVKWIIELLLEDRLAETQKNKLRDIYHSNERLINLVNDLLNITHIENGTLPSSSSPVNISEEIQRQLALFQETAGKKDVAILYKKAEGDHTLLIDPVFFIEPFKNILENAITYAPKNSKVEVRTETTHTSLIVTIQNDGPAIKKEDREKLFNKFYRGRKAQTIKPSGSGLGLYIAKLHIESLGGSIWFDSPLKNTKGVAFHIRMPMPPQINPLRIHNTRTVFV